MDATYPDRNQIIAARERADLRWMLGITAHLQTTAQLIEELQNDIFRGSSNAGGLSVQSPAAGREALRSNTPRNPTRPVAAIPESQTKETP